EEALDDAGAVEIIVDEGEIDAGPLVELAEPVVDRLHARIAVPPPSLPRRVVSCRRRASSTKAGTYATLPRAHPQNGMDPRLRGNPMRTPGARTRAARASIRSTAALG